MAPTLSSPIKEMNVNALASQQRTHFVENVRFDTDKFSIHDEAAAAADASERRLAEHRSCTETNIFRLHRKLLPPTFFQWSPMHRKVLFSSFDEHGKKHVTHFCLKILCRFREFLFPRMHEIIMRVTKRLVGNNRREGKSLTDWLSIEQNKKTLN